MKFGESGVEWDYKHGLWHHNKFEGQSWSNTHTSAMWKLGASSANTLRTDMTI